MSGHHPYQYVVLRCVPRADREEFVNVGVVLYCQALDFLGCASELDRARLRALDPTLDLDGVEAALDAVRSVCAGDDSSGSAAADPVGRRFGYLAAPRSTVLRPSPIHGGLTDDPRGRLATLLAALVG